MYSTDSESAAFGRLGSMTAVILIFAGFALIIFSIITFNSILLITCCFLPGTGLIIYGFLIFSRFIRALKYYNIYMSGAVSLQDFSDILMDSKRNIKKDVEKMAYLGIMPNAHFNSEDILVFTSDNLGKNVIDVEVEESKVDTAGTVTMSENKPFNDWKGYVKSIKNAESEYTGLVGSGYYCFTTSNGINFELVIDWENNQYNYNDTLDSEVITRYAYNIDYSPTIKQRHYAINEVARHYDNDNNDFTLIDGWLRQNGNLEDVNNSTQYVITDYIPLKSIYDIEFRCAYQWNLSYCCLYDIDKKFLKSYVPLGNVANLTYIEGKMSELSNVPANAAYAILCTITNGNNGVEGAYINSSKIIKDNLNVLKSKKGYFIGDSIMIGHDDVETTLSITHFLTEKYGMNCVNKAKGGAVLTSSTKHYAPIYQMLTSIPDDADYIIMQGGANGMAKEASKDAPWGWGSMSDSYETEFDTILQIPCLEAMCKYVITHFPTKKYGFIITYKISNWYDYWDEKSELIKQVLEKWGIPYLDWRQCGITLASQAVREQYGVDAFASYPEYSSSNTYSTDDRVIYQGQAYKANQDISIPEEWNSAHWDLVSETRYDGWHCNAKAYQQLADKTAAWMKSL